jgi:transposase
MKEKGQAILGRRTKTGVYFTVEEKKKIIAEYLKGNTTKQAIFEKYTGYPEEKGAIALWMRNLGIDDPYGNQVKSFTLKKSKKEESPDFEKLQLEKRIAELEKQVKLSEMKVIAFSTMVDIAEKEFNISIRKKYNTKL